MRHGIHRFKRITVLFSFQSFSGDVEEAVTYALNIGYRHIDCAWFYKNEAEVGKAINEKIKDGTIKREDVFITTKVNEFSQHKSKEIQPILMLPSMN